MSVSRIQLPGGIDGHPRCRAWIKSVHLFLRSSSKQKRYSRFQFLKTFFKGIITLHFNINQKNKQSTKKIYHFQEDNLKIQSLNKLQVNVCVFKYPPTPQSQIQLTLNREDSSQLVSKDGQSSMKPTFWYSQSCYLPALNMGRPCVLLFGQQNAAEVMLPDFPGQVIINLAASTQVS